MVNDQKQSENNLNIYPVQSSTTSNPLSLAYKLSVFGLSSFLSFVPIANAEFKEIERYQAALVDLEKLDTNWDSIVQGKGDNIRRRLGTVYTPPKCESPLCNFPSFTEKFVKSHIDDLDVDAFEEPSANLLSALNQADFLAYSSVFSEYGNGGGGANFIDLSHKQVEKAINSLHEIIAVLEK